MQRLHLAHLLCTNFWYFSICMILVVYWPRLRIDPALSLQYLALWWGFVIMAMALALDGKVAWDFGKWWEKWEAKRIVFVFKQQRYHWVELSQKRRRKNIKLINWPTGQLGFGDRWSNKDKCEYKMWNSINTKLLKISIARMIIQMVGDQNFNIFYNWATKFNQFIFRLRLWRSRELFHIE